MLVNSGKYPQLDKAFSRNVSSKLQEIRHSPSVDLGLTKEVAELETAIDKLKCGKALGPDNSHAE